MTIAQASKETAVAAAQQLLANERTNALTIEIARKLKDGLAHHQNGHILDSYERTSKLIHNAGLSTCLIPYRKTSRSQQWDVVVAVIDRGLDRWADTVVAKNDQSVLLSYALLSLSPMQNYVGSLATCNVNKPWYAMSPRPLMRMLVPKASRHSNAIGHGQSAAEDWEIFCEDFDALWRDGYELKPTVQLAYNRMRFPRAVAQPDYERIIAAENADNSDD